MSDWNPATTAVVYNPAAANGAVGRGWTELEAKLRRALGDVRFCATTGPGDGARQAAAAVAAGARTVLSMGGDGTHNEVVNGLMSARGADPATGAPLHADLCLGVIPAGTGGDFKRLLAHGSEGIDGAIAALPAAARTPLDVGWARFKADDGEMAERHFVNIANFGIGGLVCRKVNSGSKRLGGKATFYIGTLRALAEYRPAQIRLWLDGVDVGVFRVTNIAACNGRFAGGGMMFAPMARLSDGLLEVIVLQDGALHRTIGMTFTIYKGEHLSSPLVRAFRGRHIRAETVTADPAWIDLDGEAPGVLPLEVRVVPGALSVLDARAEVS